MRIGRLSVALMLAVLFFSGSALAGAHRLKGIRSYLETAGSLEASKKAARQHATKVARGYVDSLSAQFGLSRVSGFDEREAPGVGRHFCLRYVQQFKARDIVGAFAFMCFAPDGQTVDQRSDVVSGESLLRVREASVNTADVSLLTEREMRRQLGARFGTVRKSEVENIWVRENGGVSPGFRVNIVTGAPYGVWVAYMDGSTGGLLAFEDRVIPAVGFGFAYERDPNTTPDLDVVQLDGLKHKSRLEGQFHRILNEDGPEAVNADGYFFYQPDDTHFDEVQAYWSVLVGIDSLVTWGYEPLASIPIVVHYGSNYANAFYDGTRIALGDGDGRTLLSLAKDATVAIHEYGHYVVDRVGRVSVMSWFGDGGAIHEGHADYFACATYDRPALGEGVMLDGSPLRRCDTDFPYSYKDNPVHEAGQVWSGALWEIRTSLGSEVADRYSVDALLRLQSTGYLGATLMTDIRDAVVDSDEALFGGAHIPQLDDIFTRRGFPSRKKGVDVFAAGM